ncbi:MAG: response regulator [Acidobacteria bacterium]|nr:response regulator [Acidobacteriota bacterium]
MGTKIRRTILCVEDEAIALIARKMVLEHEGYRVLAAHDEGSALDLFTHNDIDIVVTDHLLRGITGTQIAAEMKRLKPLVPIVVLSGVAETPKDIANADLFISKGEDVQAVLGKIAALLDRDTTG